MQRPQSSMAKLHGGQFGIFQPGWYIAFGVQDAPGVYVRGQLDIENQIGKAFDPNVAQTGDAEFVSKARRTGRWITGNLSVGTFELLDQVGRNLGTSLFQNSLQRPCQRFLALARAEQPASPSRLGAALNAIAQVFEVAVVDRLGRWR